MASLLSGLLFSAVFVLFLIGSSGNSMAQPMGENLIYTNYGIIEDVIENATNYNNISNVFMISHTILNDNENFYLYFSYKSKPISNLIPSVVCGENRTQIFRIFYIVNGYYCYFGHVEQGQQIAVVYQNIQNIFNYLFS